MNRNALYASITKPKHVRKGLLLAARDTLALLKQTGNLQETTDRKLHLLAELRETMAEVHQLHMRLSQLLPAFEEHDGSGERNPSDATRVRSLGAAAPSQKQVHHKVEFIENELDKIEAKLKDLR